MEAAKHKRQVTDRLPPHDIEAERALLGCILLAPAESLSLCEETFFCGSQAFYDPRHQIIYTACTEIKRRGALPDLITVYHHLRPEGKLEQVGGEPYISGLMDVPPSAWQLPEYIRIVADKHRMRVLIALCINTVSAAYEANGDSQEIIEAFEVEAMKVREASQAVSGLVDIPETLEQLTQDYEKAHKQGQPIGLKTGFPDLDHISGAMMEGELILLAGIQSSGKTTLAMNIAWNVAEITGVGIFSLETTGKKLIHRIASSVGPFNGSAFLRGKATDGDFRKAVHAFSRIRALQERILINETAGMTMGQISASARRMHKAGARLFIIDYLQLINSGGRTEYERTTSVSKLLKNLAKDTGSPVIAISSLSRASSKEGRAPQLSDLRASGQLEYDANKVWLLHAKTSGEENAIEVHVAKNKDGPTGRAELFYLAQHFKMHSASKISDADEI